MTVKEILKKKVFNFLLWVFGFEFYKSGGKLKIREKKSKSGVGTTNYNAYGKGKVWRLFFANEPEPFERGLSWWKHSRKMATYRTDGDRSRWACFKHSVNMFFYYLKPYILSFYRTLVDY